MPSIVLRTLGVRGYQRIGRLPIAASQSFKAGDFLTANSSGLAQQALTAGNDLGAISGLTNLVIGRAIEDAQPSANDPTILPSVKTYVTFIIAEPGTQFELPIYHATAASAYPNPNQISTNLNLGYYTFPTAAGGNTLWCVNLNGTSYPKLQIVDFSADHYLYWPDTGQGTPPTSGTLAQYASCWVEFLGSATYLSGARPIVRS